MRVPIFPHCCQHLVFSCFLILVILMGIKWYLIVVLVCISLMTNDVEHYFLCLLAIDLLWRNLYSDPFSIFKLCCLLIIELQDFFIYSKYKSFIRYMIYKYFLPLLGLSFHFLGSILGNISFSFGEVQFLFPLVACVFGIISKKPLPNPRL